MPEPDSYMQSQVASPQASAHQNGGGKAGVDTAVAPGLNNEGKYSPFGKNIGEGMGNKNLVDVVDQSPLTAAAGGKINALEGLQTATVGPPTSSNQMTAPALNQSPLSGQGQGQGQGG